MLYHGDALDTEEAQTDFCGAIQFQGIDDVRDQLRKRECWAAQYGHVFFISSLSCGAGVSQCTGMEFPTFWSPAISGLLTRQRKCLLNHSSSSSAPRAGYLSLRRMSMILALHAMSCVVPVLSKPSNSSGTPLVSSSNAGTEITKQSSVQQSHVESTPGSVPGSGSSASSPVIITIISLVGLALATTALLSLWLWRKRTRGTRMSSEALDNISEIAAADTARDQESVLFTTHQSKISRSASITRPESTDGTSSGPKGSRRAAPRTSTLSPDSTTRWLHGQPPSEARSFATRTASVGSGLFALGTPKKHSSLLLTSHSTPIGEASCAAARTHPLPFDTDLTAWRASRDIGSASLSTLAQEPLHRAQLDAAVDCLVDAQAILADLYTLSTSSPAPTGGPDAVFASATVSPGPPHKGHPSSDSQPSQAVAKFFTVPESYEREHQMWHNTATRACMSATLAFTTATCEAPAVPPATTNRMHLSLSSSIHDLGARGSCTVEAGCTLMHRGVPMHTWAAAVPQTHAIPEAVRALSAIALRIHDLHSAGYVHRNLKPSNVLWLDAQQTWTLLDFSNCAVQGELTRVGFNLQCGAPEVVKAFESNHLTMPVDPAVDVWALGVMAFELVSQEPVFASGTTDGEARDALSGRSKLPWEDSARSPLAAVQPRRLRRLILACLARNPTERPRAQHAADEFQAVMQELLKAPLGL